MKVIFWNVDTQFDFMRNDESFPGTLAVPGARGIEDNLDRLTTYAHKNGIQIVFSGDWHTEKSKEFSDNPDFRLTFPPHCLIGTKGAEYVPATTPENPLIVDWRREFDREAFKLHEGDYILYKDAFDVFAGSPESPYAAACLEILNPERAVVYGVATNVCVDFAVVGLKERGVEVYAVVDAIKELPELPLEETIDGWKSRGVSLITTEEIASIV